MCHWLCLVLLPVAHSLRGRLEPEAVESPLEALRRMARSEDELGKMNWGDRLDAANSPQLAELVRGNSSEAVEILRDLAKDKEWRVRRGVANSEALKDLVEVRPEEGAQVVKALAEDEKFVVKKELAFSSALEALVETRPEEGAQVIKDLAKDEHLHVRRAVLWSEVLKTLIEVRPEEGAQVVADLLEDKPEFKIGRTRHPFWPAFKKYSTSLADSLNRTLVQSSPEDRVSVTLSRSLAKDAEVTAAKEKQERRKAQQAELKAQEAAQEAQRAQRQAEEERAKAEKAQQRAEEEKGKAEAAMQNAHFMLFLVPWSKRFGAAQETFQIVASLEPIPKPLADLTIFKRPEGSSTLMRDLRVGELCRAGDEIKRNCDPYSSDLESIPDAVEACYQMYRQAFVAKRAALSGTGSERCSWEHPSIS
eukprot:Skav215733  [mRNA]  locus=scaffold2859:69437:75509:+ [translate_table: standard]